MESVGNQPVAVFSYTPGITQSPCKKCGMPTDVTVKNPMPWCSPCMTKYPGECKYKLQVQSSLSPEAYAADRATRIANK